MKKLLLCTLFTTLSWAIQGQSENKGSWLDFSDKYQLKSSFGFQLWSTYTMGQELYDTETQKYNSVDNRWNTQLRRSRISISGQPYEQLSFKLTTAIDLIGRDALSATQGANNNANFGQIGLWNMWLRWSPDFVQDLIHITAGFQPPQIGRESINGAFKSTSFEKSWSQNYLRRAIVGTGPGRAMGINIGGQKSLTKITGFAYDLGAFSPQRVTELPNSQGVNSSTLFTARLNFYLGDPESKTYRYRKAVNYFGKRNGLSLAISASHQGKNDTFDQNQSMGLDFLFNFGMLNLDGEHHFFIRKKEFDDISNLTSFSTGYIRMSYNIPLHEKQFLEPVIMFSYFKGAMTIEEQIIAERLGSFAGTDRILEISLNLHMNPRLKYTMNYTSNSGQTGTDEIGSTFNNHFKNSNGDAIRRGNLLGFGVVAIL